MFAKSIIDSDAFLDMSLSTQALYFHLNMRADDDGFVNNPKKIQRMINASDDDMKILILKNFIIPFESGVVVIKHWKIHNYIQNDRKKDTNYQDEMKLLKVKENKAYTLDLDQCIQNGYNMDTQDRLIRVNEVNKDNNIIAQSQKAQSQKQTKNDEPKANVSAIPLNDGTEWLPEQSLFDEYVKLYPNVNVKQQFNAMRGWCVSNPTKRKTAKGIKRFVNTWLSNEQDKGRTFTKGIVSNEESERQRQEYKDYTDKLNKLRGM